MEYRITLILDLLYVIAMHHILSLFIINLLKLLFNLLTFYMILNNCCIFGNASSTKCLLRLQGMNKNAYFSFYWFNCLLSTLYSVLCFQFLIISVIFISGKATAFVHTAQVISIYIKTKIDCYNVVKGQRKDFTGHQKAFNRPSLSVMLTAW